MNDTFTVTWVESATNSIHILDMRGITDVSDFVKRSEQLGRRVTRVINKTWEAE